MNLLPMLVAGAIVLTILLYVVDRKGKQEPIVWTDALKLGTGAGILSVGVAYSLDTETIQTAIEEAVPAVQDMFVGKPAF